LKQRLFQNPRKTHTRFQHIVINNSENKDFSPNKQIKVGLTRELGANDKLLSLLQSLDTSKKLQLIEIPCIQFSEGPDLDKLSSAITKYDLIVITSPQAASVLIKKWIEIGQPAIKVVSVGKGTSLPLKAAGILPVFEPSDSTGENLSKELPLGLGHRVLYPSSSLADNKLVFGLAERGFQVTRLNTYTTSAVEEWSEQQLALARAVEVVTFASPSTVRVWAERVGAEAAAVVIGPTSAKAARDAGFKRVFSPLAGSKGVEPWAELVLTVASSSLAES
jgi:uroporphyrinogen-III synthase